MTGTLLLRGMLAGIVAAFLSFGFAKLYAEPQIDRAIAFEESHEAAHPEAAVDRAAPAHQHSDEAAAGHHHDGGETVVSRETQSGLGLLTGLLVIGAAAGGVFSIVFALARGRIGPIDPRGLSLWLAFAAYLVVVLVPGLKYPANPPAVGSAETIGMRTVLFFSMLAISVLAALFGLQTRRLVGALAGGWNGALAGVVTYGLVIAAAYMVLPAVNEVSEGFSADLLWRFRISSLATQAVLWATLGIVFGFAAEKALVRAPSLKVA